MPGNFKKEDLRIEKTLKAIQEALCKILGCHSFRRVTVNGLCEEAQISRTTFYTHFKDKYDLLEFCLANISEKIKRNIDDCSDYIRIEKIINQLILENKQVISNVVKNANDETMDLLYASMLSLLNIADKKGDDEQLSPQDIILSNFFAGGMMKFLLWQVENKFPQDFQLINPHFFSMVVHILKWKE